MAHAALDMRVCTEALSVQDQDDTDPVSEVLVFSVHQDLLCLEVHANPVVHLEVHNDLRHRILADPVLDDVMVVYHTIHLLVLEGRQVEAFADLSDPVDRLEAGPLGPADLWEADPSGAVDLWEAGLLDPVDLWEAGLSGAVDLLEAGPSGLCHL